MDIQGSPALLIYTDASHAEGSGSWGAVITGQGIETTEHGGAFKGGSPCSSTAEMRGVANALHIAVAAGHLRRGTVAVVFCDNQSVVELITRKGVDMARMKRRTPELARALQHVRAALHDIRAEVTFQWVKGHQSVAKADEHAHFNHRADRLAKQNNPVMVQRRAKQATRRTARRAKQRARAQEGTVSCGA